MSKLEAEQKNEAFSKNEEGAKNSKLVLFWLPVIVAILGLIGSITQPILHTMGYLYQSEETADLEDVFKGKEIYSIDTKAYGYDAETDKVVFHLDPMRILPEQVYTGDDIRKNRYIIGIRLRDNNVSSDKFEYAHFMGPLTLSSAKVAEITDFTSEFTEELSGECLEFSVFVASGLNTIASQTFDPRDYEDGTVRFARNFHHCL